MEDLESILNSEPKEQVAPEVPETEDQTQERLRDEHGRFVAKETGDQPAAEATEVPPTPEVKDQLPSGEYAALKAERRKRQELERQLAEVQQRLTPQQPAPPPADLWEDPNAFFEQRFNQFGQQLMQQIEAKQWSERATAQEAAARAKHEDFDDALESFHQLAAANPAIIEELRASPDVAEFAYSKGREAMLLQQHGGIEGILKAERAKWEAERGTAPMQSHVVPPPSSTASERSVGARGNPAYAGPLSLQDILGR